MDTASEEPAMKFWYAVWYVSALAVLLSSRYVA
jgi:hypothetical protein